MSFRRSTREVDEVVIDVRPRGEGLDLFEIPLPERREADPVPRDFADRVEIRLFVHGGGALREHRSASLREAKHRAEIRAAVARGGVADRRVRTRRRRREGKGVRVAIVGSGHARNGRRDRLRDSGKRGSSGEVNGRRRLLAAVNRDLERAVSDGLELCERDAQLATADPRRNRFVDAAGDDEALRRRLLILHAGEILLSELRLPQLRGRRARRPQKPKRRPWRAGRPEGARSS